MKVLYSSLIITLFLACSFAAYDGVLKFKEDGTFKMLQVTDSHYGETLIQDDLSSAQVADLIKWEDPDVVACSGDMVSGYSYKPKVTDWYKEIWNRWTAPIMEAKKPYFYLLGNHDPGADYTQRQIMELDVTNEWSLSQVGPEGVHGGSNYVVPIYDSTGTDILYYIWSFDTGFESCIDGVSGYDCIRESQVNWYKQKSQELIEKDGRKIMGLAFLHIPSPEFMLLSNEAAEVHGFKNENVCCWSINSGFYYAAQEIGNIEGFISGHDHKNDYHGNYYGIEMIYGRKTGFGGYPPPIWMRRGARVFELTVADDKKVTWDTWIRTDLNMIGTEPDTKPDAQKLCGGQKPSEQDLQQLRQDKTEEETQVVEDVFTLFYKRSGYTTNF